MTNSASRLAATGTVLTAGFGVLHVYWALGGRAGVPGPDSVTGRPWFLAYDVLSAVGLFAAAALAPRLIDRPGPRLARLALLGSVLVLLRGAVGVGQALVAIAEGHAPGWSTTFDLWFVVAGLVFLPLAVRARRLAAQATGSSAPRTSASTSPVAPPRTPRLPRTTT